MVAICRLCASLKKSETLMFIRDKNHDVCSKLLQCCQLNLDLNDVLPRGVCPECVRNLNTSFDFYVRVHDAQQALEKLLNIQQKNPNVSENITTEEEKHFEERKSFDLIASATALEADESNFHTDETDPLTTPELSKGAYEGDDFVTVEDNEVKRHDDSLVAISYENEVVQNKTKLEAEIYKLVISDESVITDANTGELVIATNCDLETKVEYEKDEVEDDFDFDNEEYEIIEVEGNDQSEVEQGKVNDVKESSSCSSYYASEDLYTQGDTGSSCFVPTPFTQMNTSTWLDYPWICVHCSQVYFTAQELVEHYEKVEEKVPAWRCVDCLKVFPRYYSLINHVRQRHRYQLALLCDICNENFNSFGELNNHRQSIHDIETLKMLLCSTCGKGFNNTNSLQIHCKCHLPDDMRLLHSCNLCDKKFRSSSNLRFHQKMHAGMKDFVCDQCGKKFIQRANLEEHLVTHLKFTPYECDMCKKLFKTSERLSKHKTRHTDDKPYKCNSTGCDKTFRTKDAMNSHGRIHTGEMPFQCEFCQKPFRFRSTLLTHHNTHTGIRPYSCDDCNHQFTNWPNYNKHMKRRHGTDLSSANPRGKKPSKIRTNINTKNPPCKIENEGEKSFDKEICYENYVEEDEELKNIETEHFHIEC